MKAGRAVVVPAVALMLVVGGAGPAVSGDTAGVAMSKAQARRVYLGATCPSDQAINAVIKGLEDEVDWATLRPLILAMASAQFRVSRVLDSPPRQWPAKVQPHVLAIGALQDVQSGMNFVLAGADSREEYQRLVDGLGEPAPALVRLLEGHADAVKGVQRHLGLPAEDACKGFD